MKIELGGQWGSLLEFMKDSKYKILQNFYFTITNFDADIKRGNWGKTKFFVNSEANRVGQNNNPIKCQERLSFSKKNDGTFEVEYFVCNKDDVKNFISKSLCLKPCESNVDATYVEKRGNKETSFTFSVKNGKASKMKEMGEKTK